MDWRLNHALIGSTLTVHLSGEIDLSGGGAEFWNALEAATAQSASEIIVLDLQSVTFLSIGAARILDRFMAAITDRGADLRVVIEPGSVVERTLNLFGRHDSVRVDRLSVRWSSGREVIDIADLAEAEAVLNAIYGRLRLDANGSAPRGLRLATAPVGPVRLDQVTFRMALHAEAAPLGDYVFGQLKSGRIRFSSHSVERSYAPGDVFLSIQPDDPYSADIDNSSIDLAVISQALIDDVAEPAPGTRSGPVRITGYDPVSTAAAERWKQTYRFVLDNLRSSPNAAGQTLIAGTAARLLASTALATFPNTAVDEPDGADRHDANPQTLRRAIAFIESNADRDIAIADVARAASVTARAVQLAFRRHLDTTPLGYLRQVRLQRARDELLAAAPESTTIAAVAARWGFLDAGQFARHYRAAFGELPSKSLER